MKEMKEKLQIRKKARDFLLERFMKSPVNTTNWVPTEEQYQEIFWMAKLGLKKKDICAYFNIWPSAFYEKCKKYPRILLEIQKGEASTRAELSMIIYDSAIKKEYLSESDRYFSDKDRKYILEKMDSKLEKNISDSDDDQIQKIIQEAAEEINKIKVKDY